jgi:hypothetical protein
MRLASLDSSDLAFRIRGTGIWNIGPLALFQHVWADELIKLEATASGHRADFERERERAEALMAELLKMTGDAMAAKEAAARWLKGVQPCRVVYGLTLPGGVFHPWALPVL